MQPYRTVRPHESVACPVCATGGHQLCQHDGCDDLAEVQSRRHATDTEFAAIPEGLRPRDGVAHMSVFTCGDHEPDMICATDDHIVGTSEAAAGPCPKCGATDDAPCTKANGKPRTVDHGSRSRSAVPVVEYGVCRHAHRADCGGQGACACRPDDPAPAYDATATQPVP